MCAHTSIQPALLPQRIERERIAAAIGLVSDTHLPQRLRELPSALFAALQGVDLVLHAGDLGLLATLDQLSQIAPIVAVHGNDDTEEAQRELPYQQVIAVAGQRVLLCHTHWPDPEKERAARQDDRWPPKLAWRVALGRRAGAQIVVFGHTHVPLTCRHEGVLLVNPGALAAPNFATRQRVRTVAILYLLADGTSQVVHVDLEAPQKQYELAIDWEAGFRAATKQFTEDRS